MEPKFQSSFIPRGPSAQSSAMPSPSLSMGARRPVERNIVSVVCGALFTLSIIFALGVFGYKLFLNYRIGQMGKELEAARAALEPETVNELIRLNSRIVSTKELIERHRIISPVFAFLQNATPKSVRYTDFEFNMTAMGLELTLHGEASSYAALASAAEVFNRSDSNFKKATFSDLQLDTKGNVGFSLQLEVEPTLLSYNRFIDANGPAEALLQAPLPVPASAGAAGLPSTTTAATATPPVMPR
jgi:hypothetical protein